MKKRNLKKLLILNIPYAFIGLFATKLAEGWRLAEGADASQKFLHLPVFSAQLLLVGNSLVITAPTFPVYRTHACRNPGSGSCCIASGWLAWQGSVCCAGFERSAPRYALAVPGFMVSPSVRFLPRSRTG